MASYDTGYGDERFQHPVGQSFHCGICYNVVKDPTMCRHNEHLFCRACITRSLVNSQTCPSCVEPLTVETLTQPSRTVMNLLSELKIRCQFFNRGCQKFIELGNLERHVTDCGFSPAVCSNEGCRVEVNKQDLLHHEMVVCELRRVQCHSCKDIRQEMDIVKVSLAAINAKLDKNEENVKAIKYDVVAKVQEELNKQEETNRQLQAENVKIKESLNKMTEQLDKMARPVSRQVPAAREHEKKEIAEADRVDGDPRLVVVGGWNQGSLNSVEMFSLSDTTWKPLQRMKEARTIPSSFLHNNLIYVCGGQKNGRGLTSMENISVNVNESLAWKSVRAALPVGRHRCVVHNKRLLVIGGNDSGAHFDKISEISLVPPCTGTVLATMPIKMWLYCVLLLGSKIIIIGRKKVRGCRIAPLDGVLMYDIARNEFNELAPLPYSVHEMAAVKWGDDNVIIGGASNDEKPLNEVLIYNIKTQKSHMLPEMKYKRKGCVAAVVKDTVIVMGGDDGRVLNSVESFRFDRFTWEELPPMQEARSHATAVLI